MPLLIQTNGWRFQVANARLPLTMSSVEKSPRMRFAPSPTGSLHVGGARTALYNWLVARQARDGKFLLRIEDTDLARSTRESEESMLADLEWLGLDWDEGPQIGGPCVSYRQSERSDIYKEAADFLVRAGHAYPCFCTEEELDMKRIAAKMAGSQVAYDGTWRNAPKEVIRRLLEEKMPHTYRFKTSKGTIVNIDDKVRGYIEWDVQATIGDFILLRSTGVPVYNFCVAVDDALMGVSTVVRAEEHLTNTVRQLLILEALGFKAPSYAHASLILGSDKSKLSKRHGATSCGQFRERGYLPDAMINYLALLGWNDGTDKEVYSRQELIEAFDLSRVTASPAMFDDAKLRWLNGQHLRAMPLSKLTPIVIDHFRVSGLLQEDVDLATPVMSFVTEAIVAAQPKAEVVTDITDFTRAILSYPLLQTIGAQKEGTMSLAGILEDDFVVFAIALIRSYDAFEAPAFCYNTELAADANASTVFDWIQRIGGDLNRSKKNRLMSARLALTGSTTGIDVPSQLKIIQMAAHAGCGDNVRVEMEQRISILRNYATDAVISCNDALPTSCNQLTHISEFATFCKLRQVYESNRRIAQDDAVMFDILNAAHRALINPSSPDHDNRDA